jgi:hypothetical protein
MAGMQDDALLPLPLATIAKQQGFPLAGQGAAAPSIPTTVPIPKVALAPGPVAPLKAGVSAGTTELIPGANDWIKQLILDMIPTRSANAAGVAPPQANNAAGAGMPLATTSNLSRVQSTPTPPDQSNFFSRLIRGLVGPEDTQPLGHGGVRG